MREILFRGIIKNDNSRYKRGQWAIGDLVRLQGGNDGKPHIYGCGEVFAETVGQYTGELDKNGTKIFEGDIVDVKYNIDYVGVAKERIGMFRVVFHNGCFMKAKIEGCGLYHFISTDEHTVIGNIYDNPELLKECEGKRKIIYE